MGLEELRLCDDVSPARWIADCIHPFAADVGSIVPEGFDAYARIFHPAGRNEGEEVVEVRWSEVADANGTIAHAEMQWPAISRRDPYANARHSGLWDHVPNEGSLPAEVIAEIVEVLARHTKTPHAVRFAVWSGYSGLVFDARARGTAVLTEERPSIGKVFAQRAQRFAVKYSQPPAATFELPKRAYYLLSGRSKRRPNLSGGGRNRRTCGGPKTGVGASPPRSTSTRRMSERPRGRSTRYSPTLHSSRCAQMLLMV